MIRGDATGPAASTVVVAIQGVPVSPTGPTAIGAILIWDGAQAVWRLPAEPPEGEWDVDVPGGPTTWTNPAITTWTP